MHCVMPECKAGIYRVDKCYFHYTESWLAGRPECRFDSCDRPSVSNKSGLCTGHNAQVRRGLDLTPLSPRRSRAAARAAEGRKTCVTCEVEKPTSEFPRNKNHPDGFSYVCKGCARDYRDVNKDKLAESRVEYSLLSKYGLTKAAFDAKLAEQNGCCGVCGTDDPGVKGWMVDHDHECCPEEKTCGQCLRKILCNRCNLMLGLSHDDPEILRAAADYVEAHRPSTSSG